jgi:peptidylprolyl isomerase
MSAGILFLTLLDLCLRLTEIFILSKEKGSEMEKVEKDLFVSVDYKGTLANGEVFDSSEGRPPLEVQMGAGQLIKGFEDALAGMSINEKKTFTIAPEEAYGLRDEDNTHSFDRKDIPPEMNPSVGQVVGLSSADGGQIPAKVTHVDDEKVIVDLNHPLAGESLTFAIEVVGISASPTQAHGCAEGGCESCSSC